MQMWRRPHLSLSHQFPLVLESKYCCRLRRISSEICVCQPLISALKSLLLELPPCWATLAFSFFFFWHVVFHPVFGTGCAFLLWYVCKSQILGGSGWGSGLSVCSFVVVETEICPVLLSVNRLLCAHVLHSRLCQDESVRSK